MIRPIYVKNIDDLVQCNFFYPDRDWIYTSFSQLVFQHVLRIRILS